MTVCQSVVAAVNTSHLVLALYPAGYRHCVSMMPNLLQGTADTRLLLPQTAAELFLQASVVQC